MDISPPGCPEPPIRNLGLLEKIDVEVVLEWSWESAWDLSSSRAWPGLPHTSEDMEVWNHCGRYGPGSSWTAARQICSIACGTRRDLSETVTLAAFYVRRPYSHVHLSQRKKFLVKIQPSDVTYETCTTIRRRSEGCHHCFYMSTSLLHDMGPLLIWLPDRSTPNFFKFAPQNCQLSCIVGLRRCRGNPWSILRISKPFWGDFLGEPVSNFERRVCRQKTGIVW